jgi:hypothetical protein
VTTFRDRSFYEKKTFGELGLLSYWQEYYLVVMQNSWELWTFVSEFHVDQLSDRMKMHSFFPSG